MKKLLYISIFLVALASQAQPLCLQPMCVAARAKAGDTAYIGAGLKQIGNFKSIAFSLKSGPNAPAMGAVQTFLTGTDTGVSQVAVINTVPGTYLFNIIAMDNGGLAIPGIDTLIVTPGANIPPVANAGAAQVITLPVNSATLSGSGTDSDGTIVSYSWIQIGGPSIVSWTNITPAKTVVGKLVQGIYTFQLAVTDNQGATGKPAFTTVTVQAGCPVIPPARTATGLQITINGQVFTIPLAGTKITYSDGTTQ